jgi:hypothetical protein
VDPAAEGGAWESSARDLAGVSVFVCEENLEGCPDGCEKEPYLSMFKYYTSKVIDEISLSP